MTEEKARWFTFALVLLVPQALWLAFELEKWWNGEEDARGPVVPRRGGSWSAPMDSDLSSGSARRRRWWSARHLG